MTQTIDILSSTKPFNPLDDLRARVTGSLLEPGETGFDTAIAGWSLGHTHHPAAVLVAHTEADALEAVRFARDHGVPLAVQATGHGFVRSADGGLLLNVSHLNAVRINPEAQTATVQPGATWGEVLEAAGAHGLTGLTGDTPSVGAVGYILGGGTGWFVRKYGLGCDSLLECRIVTPDGVLRTVNASSDPELFWGLRGGGGGFGVVTSMTLKLYPAETVLAGQVIFPLERAKEVMRAYRDGLKTVPDELTSRLVLLRGPDAEFMPPFMRGRVALAVQLCFAGSKAEAEGVIAPLLTQPGALMQIVQEIAPAELGRFFNAPPSPTESHGRAEHLDTLSDAAIDALVEFAARETPPMYLLEVRHLGGAMARVPDDATAFAHRRTAFLVNVRAVVLDPRWRASAVSSVKDFAGVLQPFASGSVSPNFVGSDEGLERDRAAYPGLKTMRLSLLKMRFDPKNLFCFARTPGSRR
jgi:FAD binding domain